MLLIQKPVISSFYLLLFTTHKNLVSQILVSQLKTGAEDCFRNKYTELIFANNIFLSIGEDKEQRRKLSTVDGENVPGLKSRAIKLPNHITYRTAVDEMHDNLG